MVRRIGGGLGKALVDESVSWYYVKKLTIVPCLSHLWTENWKIFPHDCFPDLAHLSLSLQDGTVTQFQDEVSQFLLGQRVVWRLRSSGNDSFPDTPELRLDFGRTLRAHEDIFSGFAE